jgi:Rrf2 family protein
LRGVFELALHGNGKPIKVHEIAEAQDIPARFLEVILNQLSHGGFVESSRGKNGGYQLSRAPSHVTVGEIISFLHGPASGVSYDKQKSYNRIKRSGDYAFARTWEKADQAVAKIYDNTTFAELVKQDLNKSKDYVLNYSI